MNIRIAVAATLGATALLLVGGSFAASSPPPPTQASITVEDHPGNNLIEFPTATMTVADLAKLPASTVTLPGGTTESGPTVSSVLSQAGFKLISSCKNDQLHYWIEASSLDGSGAVISDGELDPLFGNNPAILSLAENGVPLTAPRLAVPKDATLARDVGNVFDITVGRADQQLPQSKSNVNCTPPGYQPIATPPASAGDVLINGDVPSGTTVTWSQLTALPQVDQTVSFLQGSTPNMREELGPTLYNVLSSAVPGLTSIPVDDTRIYVEATSSEDGASTLVSWDEFDPARIMTADPNKQFLLSRGEAVLPSPPGAPFHLFIPPGGTDTGPRLTTPGDVRGGRYDFGVQIVTVFRAPVIPAPTTPGPNLGGKNLKNTPLSNTYLVNANLAGANLNSGNASGALLTGANLVGANLNNADLSGALLNGANLRGANLHGADLSGANLTGADLTGANLNGVTWSNTTCPDGTSSDADGGACSA